MDPSQWKDQLWQYGSNRGQGQPDPVWDQDGVAPQCSVTGLTDQSRAFIPATYGNGEKIPKGYLESHKISNYGWIFEIKSSEPKGYVIPCTIHEQSEQKRTNIRTWGVKILKE
ncbi:hypothetical protein [Dyadobacter diqingensis]|uniref:hypothetical protein n=1 Tax=Dyadobacter diqingensis TaxID=2938121 RepID=UPI0020C19D32|nr:hypothetical protein [Dyadobacter diqingensis]